MYLYTQRWKRNKFQWRCWARKHWSLSLEKLNRGEKKFCSYISCNMLKTEGDSINTVPMAKLAVEGNGCVLFFLPLTLCLHPKGPCGRVHFLLLPSLSHWKFSLALRNCGDTHRNSSIGCRGWSYPRSGVHFAWVCENYIVLLSILFWLGGVKEWLCFWIASAILQGGLKNKNIENLNLVHEINPSKRTDVKVKGKVMRAYNVLCRFTEGVFYTHIYCCTEISPMFLFPFWKSPTLGLLNKSQ